MFGLEEEEQAEIPPPRSQAAPQGRFLAGDDPAPAAGYKFSGSPSWQMIKLRMLPKMSYQAYGLVSDTKGAMIKYTLEAGTPLRVYSGKMDVTFADGAKTTLSSPNPKGEVLVETVPDDKSRFWNIYDNTPANQTLVASADYLGTSNERIKHLMWAPIKMAGSEAPDLLDEAIKAKYDAVQLPAVPPPPTPPDKDAPKQDDTTNNTILSVALGVGGALLLASLLDSRKK
jgi:hypothetical protein